jgi:uncharacterized iron-regulated protein
LARRSPARPTRPAFRSVTAADAQGAALEARYDPGMPKPSSYPALARAPRAAARPTATLLVAALLTACVSPGVKAPAPEGTAAQRDDALTVTHGSYVLNRSLADFYDSEFVLSDGASAPRPIQLDALADKLAKFDVVFYGESHGHDGVHLQEMKVLAALVQRDPHWILSLEQFERDVQSVLDEYLAGRVGENALIDKGRAWNNYASSYRPLVLFAKEHHLPVIAAEAPGWAISCIGQAGTEVLDKFTPEERSWVAKDLHADDGAYRDKFMKFMGGSPSHGDAGEGSPAATARAQRSFAAQAARDDTMAESIEDALRQHPGYKLLHVTGSFHAASFLGTVERLRLRDPSLKIAVIDPVAVDDPRVPAFAPAELAVGTVLQLIYPVPEDFLDGEDTSAMMAHVQHEREAHRCKYLPAEATPPPDLPNRPPQKLPPGHPPVHPAPKEPASPATDPKHPGSAPRHPAARSGKSCLHDSPSTISRRRQSPVNPLRAPATGRAASRWRHRRQRAEFSTPSSTPCHRRS